MSKLPHVTMGVASNRQEGAIASSWILQNKKNDQDHQLFSLQKSTRRQTGICKPSFVPNHDSGCDEH